MFGKTPRSMAELDAAVQRGLPKRALVHVAETVFMERAEQRALLHAVVPEATFKRRRDRLTAGESEKTERLARIVAQAEETWHDKDGARRFLTRPHPMLDGRRPIEVAITELGARRVESILVGLVYGLPV
jgi:putative toxin-antitoxin system antitoxin component (TIGR02293 family)